MKFDPKIHHRHSIRLQGYDYSQTGAYFVTMVTWQRECLFGNVVNGEMVLNEAGKIVQWEWERLSQWFNFLELGANQVMPNHFHGTLLFHDVGATRPDLTGASSGKTSLQTVTTDSLDVGATRPDLTGAPLGKTPWHNVISDGPDGSPLLPHGPKSASLGAIIGQFKSRVTKRLWKNPELAGTPIWQRNYYEHIIRDEREMDNIWRYIESNPATWADDEENPVNL